MENDVHQQDEKDEHHGHPCEHHSEVAYAATELRLRWPHGQTMRNLAAGGIFSRADDDRGADPCLNGSAQENAVACVRDAVFLLGKVSHRLLYRQRLSREHGFAHVQVLYVQ